MEGFADNLVNIIISPIQGAERVIEEANGKNNYNLQQPGLDATQPLGFLPNQYFSDNVEDRLMQ